MSGRPLPTFLALLGPQNYRDRSLPSVVTGLILSVITLIGAETALSFVFDPRYRDFPFAALTMAVVPFAAVSLLNRPKDGTRPIAETAFAGLFAAAALYTFFNEGRENWQSLWTCVTYVLFAATLWRARALQIPE
jgi:glucan 1,3-beta-glucosidase